MLTLAEHGFIGFFLFLFCIYLSWQWYFPINKWVSPLVFVFATGVFASLVSQAVFYAFDHFFSDQRLTFFWAFFGAGIALERLNQTHLADLRRATARSAERLSQNRALPQGKDLG
jgi:hypothetical protein